MPNTNSWLCIYAIAQLGRPYKMGFDGQLHTSTKQKLLQHDWESSSTAYPNPNYNIPAKTHDCSGLIRGALRCDDVNGPQVRSTDVYHGATKQYWDYCTQQRGTSISTFPRIPGMLVFRSSGSHTKEHVGIYIGTFVDLNGNTHEDYVIDAKGKDYGVIMGPLFKSNGSSRWDCWGQLDCCTIDTSEGTHFDARTNSAETEVQQEGKVKIEKVNVATENMKPFIATILGEYNPHLDYNRIKDARISGMMLYGGEMFDISHNKHTYINSHLIEQVSRCNSSGLPYALYVNVRAKTEIEADAECKALYYVISQCPPKLGLWLSSQMNNSKELNDRILEIYYKFIKQWGLIDKCGLYVTPKQLETITWNNFYNRFYLWEIAPKDISEVDDELLNPDMFDVDGVSAKEVKNLTFRESAENYELYETKNDRHDMTLRQVGYLDTNYSLSNNPSNIAISVINYTTALGDLYEQFAPAVSTLNSIKVDTSQLQSEVKICIDFLVDSGYSASAASGIVACLNLYSKLNTEYSKQIGMRYVYGIGAWDELKLKEMKSRVGPDWKTNLTGQLEYLLYDIETNYSAMVLGLRLQQLDKENAETAAKAFLTIYNPIFLSNDNIEEVKHTAGEYYDRLIIAGVEEEDPVVFGTAHAMILDINGNMLNPQYGVDIPADIPQTGIIDDYTSYSHWYSKWNKKSPQKKLANLWGEQGFSCDKGIATIGGYYCCAVRPKFGRCGEIIVVTLEDGTNFTGIICDEKGEDAGSEWGHIKGNGNISLIEWERVKTSAGVVITSGTTSAGVDTKGFDDWWKKKVINITNYGKYIDVGWS